MTSKSEMKRVEALKKMKEEKRREWWIAPEWTDVMDEDDSYFGSALTSHPRQGPLEWQASLVHVTESLPGDLILSASEMERLREALKEIDDAGNAFIGKQVKEALKILTDARGSK
jgi:hypothetical protein